MDREEKKGVTGKAWWSTVWWTADMAITGMTACRRWRSHDHDGNSVSDSFLMTHSHSLKDRMNNPLYMQHVQTGLQIDLN